MATTDLSDIPTPPSLHSPITQATDKTAPFKYGTSTNRYLTHISCDKPIYKPKEQALFRGVILNAFTFAPLTKNVNGVGKIISPKGTTCSLLYNEILIMHFTLDINK